MAQQDSHEFLTILIDWLHSDLQYHQSLAINRQMKLSPAEKAWEEFVKCKQSKILDLFYGQIKSTVKCTSCYTESATYESFSNLSLELVVTSDDRKYQIQQCLKMYFSGEEIHGWNCPKCKIKKTAIKLLNISKLPTILVIHLKRFLNFGWKLYYIAQITIISICLFVGFMQTQLVVIKKIKFMLIFHWKV